MPKHISELTTILRTQLPWHKQKLNCLAQFIMAVICCRTVNLTQLANHLYGKAKPASHYRRLQRFIAQWPKNMDALGAWILIWFYDANAPITLTMDRTNWQFGKAKINFLVVGVVYKRIAIPFMWTVLTKAGNSNTGERIELMSRVCRYLDKTRIVNLLCDREFVGRDWFKWLLKEGIPFKIRIKHNYVTQNVRGQDTTVDALFHGLSAGEKNTLPGKRHITGCKMYLTGARSHRGELIVIASPDQQGCAIEQYLERWEIETLFENLKSRGFDLESTHITHPDRLHGLLGLLTLAFAWAYRVGEWRVEEREELIKLKKHGRPTRSLFRHGLDYIRGGLLPQIRWQWIKPLIELWKYLIPPIPVIAL